MLCYAMVQVTATAWVCESPPLPASLRASLAFSLARWRPGGDSSAHVPAECVTPLNLRGAASHLVHVPRVVTG